MKQIQVISPHHLALVDSPPLPNLEADELRIQIQASGICGSDIHVYEGQNPMASYPVVLGHEAAGIVIETGVNVTNCKIGDHVILEPLIACGQCYACKKARPNACQSMKARGCHVDGFFRHEIVIPAKSAYPISRSIPWKDAAMVEPYTIAAQAAFRSKAEKGDRVLILGAGTMGLTVIDVFQLLGCQCIALDIDKNRLDLAKKHGAAEIILSDKTKNQNHWVEQFSSSPPNIVVEATGIPAFLTLAVDIVSSAGRVVSLGFSSTLASISPLALMKKELDLLGVRHQTHQFAKVIDWINNGKIQAGSIVNKTVNFSQAVAVFQEIHEAHQQGKNPGKILFEWS